MNALLFDILVRALSVVVILGIIIVFYKIIQRKQST